MSIQELRKSLEWGDHKRIALMAGVSNVYVYKILRGVRPARSENAQNVIRSAKALLRQRAMLRKQMNTSTNNKVLQD